MWATARTAQRSICGVLAAVAALACRGEAQNPPALTSERAVELLSVWSTGSNAAARDAALEELLSGIGSEQLSELLERDSSLTQESAAAAAFWRRLGARRPELASAIHAAWLERRVAPAREGALELATTALVGGTQVLEDLRPQIALFPPELWAVGETSTLVDLVRDLAALGGAKLPLLVDPAVIAIASEPRTPNAAAAPRGLRPDQILRDAASVRSLVVSAYPGALWLTAADGARRPSPVDLAERLLAAAEAEDLPRRQAAFEALGALGVPGWHDWCEWRARSEVADPALAGALFGAGPRGIERGLEPWCLDVYLPADLVDSPELRARFRALWRRCLQAPVPPSVLARLEERSAEDSVRGRLAWRLLAWRNPERHVERLRRALAEGDADQVVFAWRCLRRGGNAAMGAELVPSLRRHPRDARLRELVLATLEERGLPAPNDRADMAELRAALESHPEFRDLGVELDLRCADAEQVGRALRAVLALSPTEAAAVDVAARLAASFARADPERRVAEGPRALVFRALGALRPADVGQKHAAAAFAHRMGWILVGEQLLRSEGVDPVPPPRLRDLDPYEGGGGR